MRIRTIKPEFFTHEGLFEAERATKLPLRIAFVGLWCVADRSGRFRWEPRRLGVSVLPYDPTDFSRVLDALVTRGFIVKYAVDGVDYGCIPSFSRHQVINNREKESIIPECPPIQDSDATGTREPRVEDASKEEGKGNGRDGKGTEEGKGASKARGTIEECVAFAVELKVPESDGEACFHKWEGNGWKNGQSVIKDWRATMRSWKSAGYLPSQKHANSNHRTSADLDARKTGITTEHIPTKFL
jgi:hypothetical protein